MENKLLFAPRDLAKYPFVPQAAEHIQALDLKIADLTSPEYSHVLKRAEKRIEEAILSAEVSEPQSREEVEILSFPIAVMLASAINDSFLKRRYALAEAKRTSNLLKKEDPEKIMQIARAFNWRIRLIETSGFALHFADFLRNSTVFHETKWKLVNQELSHGEVYLTRDETARLLEEENRRYVGKKLEAKIEVHELPENVAESVERLKQLLENKKGKIEAEEEMPKEVVREAFPPCIGKLYEDALSGRHVSHIGRFTLASFLVSSGMSADEVVDLFRTQPDFDERLTRYQVEHIAGGRGAKEKYIPPTCDTMRTHRVCSDIDETCRLVRHPLGYYRIKLRRLELTATEPQAKRS